MIRHGASSHLSSNLDSTIADDLIEDIIQKGEEKTKELKQKYASVGLDDLQKIGAESMNSYEWEGENYSNKVCIFNYSIHRNLTLFEFSKKMQIISFGCNRQNERERSITPLTITIVMP